MVLSFGQSVYLPGVFAYLTAKKQKDARLLPLLSSEGEG
jgi:hypothetical protein